MTLTDMISRPAITPECSYWGQQHFHEDTNGIYIFQYDIRNLVGGQMRCEDRRRIVREDSAFSFVHRSWTFDIA